MNRPLNWLFFTFILLLLPSCGNEDGLSNDSIIGSWYGTRTYYNPAAGTKYQYLTIRFESNGTGSLEYESPVSFSAAKFMYTINGKNIECRGAYANTYGEVDGDFQMTLKIDGNRLLPDDQFGFFILTKDNSVMTDGNGNEIINQSEALQQVWIDSDGKTVVKFNSSTYDEWVLTTAFAGTYSAHYEGTYSYDPARRIINLNGSNFEIIVLSSSVLSMQHVNSGKVFNYNRGTEKDIPVKSGNNDTPTVDEYDYGDKYNGPKSIKRDGSVIFNNVVLDKFSRIKNYTTNGTTMYYEYGESEIQRYWLDDNGNKAGVKFALENGRITKIIDIDLPSLVYTVTYDTNGYVNSITRNGSAEFKSDYRPNWWTYQILDTYIGVIERSERIINWSLIDSGVRIYTFSPIWAADTDIDIFLYEQGLFGSKHPNKEIVRMTLNKDGEPVSIINYTTTLNSSNKPIKSTVDEEYYQNYGNNNSHVYEYSW